MEYSDSRDELKKVNFFEQFNGGPYNNAKIVMLISCNTLAYPTVRKYLKELFPNAIILGHIFRNPSNSTPIIEHFLKTYFSDSSKAYDEEHIFKSWLSYYDKSKNSLTRRGYGLAVLKNSDLFGIEVDGSYPV